jgi:hypothetical protein
VQEIKSRKLKERLGGRPTEEGNGDMGKRKGIERVCTGLAARIEVCTYGDDVDRQ